MDLKYVDCKISGDLATLSVDDFILDSYKGTSKLIFRFITSNDEYPTGGHGDNIKYSSCKIVDDYELIEIVVDGLISYEGIDFANFLQETFKSLTTLNEQPFNDLLKEIIEERM